MTNDEAIAVIENEIQIDVRLCTDEQVERFQTALYMAISVLRAEAAGEQLREVPHGKTKNETLQSICDRANEIAYPPAHIEREAWTAEWREFIYEKMVGFNRYRKCHYFVCTSCGKQNAVKSNFCPVCGKAMTPEAWEELEKRFKG